MKDLTVVAIPFYFGSMGAEYLWLRSHPVDGTRAFADGADGEAGARPRAGLYERKDTIASLSMGVGSLVVPLVMPKLLGPLVPGRGRHGRLLLTCALGAAAVTSLADVVVRLEEKAEQASPAEPSTAGRRLRRRAARLARPVAAGGGVAAVVAGGLAVTTTWASRTAMSRVASRRRARSLGSGPVVTAAAILAWDFLYYWNHRAMHESRFMWAIHVVHHSSEHYNLSTALRQPVAEAFGTFLPYSALTLLGFDPPLVNTARGVNLLYQFWIHSEVIGTLGPLERFLNTPSHHRVHHGSNGPYLDRNHGSILILWDKLFGTFEPESRPVVYGLTKNINTFNPARIATHEYAAMFADIARSRTWRDRLGFVLRGPGWAARRRAEQLAEVGDPSAVRQGASDERAQSAA